MPWYRRKAVWIAALGLSALLLQQFGTLTLSDEVKSALLLLISALVQALSGAPTDALPLALGDLP